MQVAKAAVILFNQMICEGHITFWSEARMWFKHVVISVKQES